MKKIASAKPRLTALALAVQAACGMPALALPQGAVVVNGSAQISQPAANVLQVQAGHGAIIHWQRFSIGGGETTRFVQPDASSAVLNRVTGGEVSQLLGTLQSNGRVFLVNPNGIVVGAGARIDTNSFIASTLDIADADFLAGRLKFLAGGVAGGIHNGGVITAGPGGKVALIAPDIVNSGIITAPDGQILLAAGRSIEITSSDLAGVRFEIRAPADSVLNLGKLIADNGAVRLFASTLRQEGVIRANRLVQGADGTIALVASGDVSVAAGSVTSASGAAGLDGGRVTIQSEAGTTRVAGQVLATGAIGGQVHVLGDRVAVEGGAMLEASGRNGGGTVLVGGAYQGADANVQNARRTYVAEGAVLRADATDEGDGGQVIVWADENTRYHGALSARGGAKGGDGGFAEVSGKQNLEFRGTADLSAPQGAFGTLLLDPQDIVVASGSGILPTVVDEFADFDANVATIDPGRLNALGANVVLAATRDIYVKDAVTLTTQGAGITLLAGGQAATEGTIYLEHSTARPGGITTTGGDVVLRAQSVEGGPLDVGAINTQGGRVDIAVTGSLAYTGAITTAGGSVSLAATGQVNYADVRAGSGAISVSAQGGINSGTYVTTGTAGMSSGSYISGTDITAGVINLQAQSSIYASVAATDRVNATSTNSSVELYAGNDGPLRLGTLSATSTNGRVRLNAPTGGIAQAAGGSIDTRELQVYANDTTAGIGSAAAPLSLVSTASVSPGVTAAASVRVYDLAGPMHLNVGSTTAVRNIELDGNLAGLSTFRLAGGSNLGAWTFANDAGRLSVSGSSTGGFDGALTVRVSDAGLKVPSLNLQGGGSASFEAYNGDGATLGNITTTRANGTGLQVTVGNCTYSYAECLSTAPITMLGDINVTGNVQLRVQGNGDVTSTGTIAARDLVIDAGGLFNGQYRYSASQGYFTYAFTATQNNIDLNSVVATRSVDIANSGNGSLRIGTLTATRFVDLENGRNYQKDLGTSWAWARTTGGIEVGNSDPVSTTGGVSITNRAMGDIAVTGGINRQGSLSVSAEAGSVTTAGLTATSSIQVTASGAVTTGDLLSTSGGVTLSAGGATSVGDIAASSSISVSSGADFSFDKISSTFGNVTLSSTAGAIATRIDDAATDVAGRTISITANGTEAGFIGNTAFDRPMDILSSNGQTVTLSAGRDIGSLGKEVRVDTTSTVDIASASGQYHVRAEDLTVNATGLRNVSTVRLSASAAGVGAAGQAGFTSANLSVTANSDGTDLTLSELSQSAGTLHELSFRSTGTGGLRFGGVALATATGHDQLNLTSGGSLTQAGGDITMAGNTIVSAAGDVTLGNVTLSNVLLDGLQVTAGGNVSTGNLTARSINISGQDVSLGTVTGTGTYRGYWDYQFVPRFGYSNYWQREEVTLTAAGNLSTGNVASATWATLTAGQGENQGITVGAGSGTVTGGNAFSSSGAADQVSLQAGSVRVGAVSGNVLTLAGADIQASSLNGQSVRSSGGLLQAGAVTSTGMVDLRGTTLTLGRVSGSSVTLDAQALVHTGDVAATGNLSITVAGPYAPQVNLSAGNAATVVVGGDFTVGQPILDIANPPLDGTGTLSAPRVTLETTAESGGNILANLQGTSDLTLRADAGYQVSTNAYLTRLDVQAQWDRSALNGNATVSSSVFNGQTYDWQYFSVESNLRNSFATELMFNTLSLLPGGYRLNASASFANPSLRNAWNISYRDTSANAVAGGLSVDVGHQQGGSFNLRLDSDTDLTSVWMSGPRLASTVDLQTGGSIYLDSLYTNGGSVTALSRGSDTVAGGIVIGDVVTDIFGGTAGNVTLTASKGSITFDPGNIEVANRGISTSSYVDATPSDYPSGRVSLSAPLGSIGSEEVAVPVAYATSLSLQAANTVNVNVTGALGALSIEADASAAATGTVRVANTSFVNTTTDFTGVFVERSGGNFRLNGLQGDVAAPGDFSLYANGGGIVVGDNIANLRNLALDARGGDLSISAVGRTSALGLSATGTVDLSASGNLDLLAGADASASVTVSAGALRTLTAGGDLRLVADAASVQVTSGSTALHAQTFAAGNDFIVQGGAAAGAVATLQTLGTVSYQTTDVGRDLVVRGGSGANATARLDASGTHYSHSITVGRDLTVEGGSGAGAAALLRGTASYQSVDVGGSLAVTGGVGTDATASLVNRPNVSWGEQTLYVDGNLAVVGGKGTGAFASVSNSTPTVSGTQRGSVGGYFLVQGGNAAVGQGTGAYASFSGGYQDFRSISGPLKVFGGTASGNHAEITSTSSQYFGNAGYETAATDSVQVAGGSAEGTHARIQATGSQGIEAGRKTGESVSGDITVTGGSGLNAYAAIEAGSSQDIGSASNGCSWWSGCLSPTQNVLVTGGTGTGAYARISATSGSQDVYFAGALRVTGGTGASASAQVQAGGSQEIGVNSLYGYDVSDAVEVVAGSGGIAALTAGGWQELYIAGDIRVQGGTAAGMTATISTTGSQQIGYTYYSGYDTTNNVIVQGGSASGASASISAGTGQTVHAVNGITVAAGTAAGADASLTNGTGAQTIGANRSEWYHRATQAITLAGGADASASIDNQGGSQQRVTTSGNLSLTGGTGLDGGATIVGGGQQSVYAGGAIAITGGTSNSLDPQSTGILMVTDGDQSVQAGTSLTLTGGSGLTSVGISHEGLAGAQTVTAGGNIVLQAPNAGSGIVAIASDSAGLQDVSSGGAISISNAAGQGSWIYAAGPQAVRAASMSIHNGSSVANSQAAVVSDLDQSITLTGDGSTAGSATLSIRNTGSGAQSVAGIFAGGSLSLSVTDENYDTAGAVTVGHTADTGASLIEATNDLSLVAGSLTIQGGATAAATAAVNATGAASTMSISTLYGPMQLLAGNSGSSTIDPPVLSVVSNGSVLLQGGSSASAFSNITAGTFNLAATFGDLLVQGAGGAATITADSFVFIGPNQVNLAGGTITATTDGKIFIPGSCVNCTSPFLVGNWTVFAYVPPPIPPSLPPEIASPISVILSLDELNDPVWELIPLEDGTGITLRTRRNQCL